MPQDYIDRPMTTRQRQRLAAAPEAPPRPFQERTREGFQRVVRGVHEAVDGVRASVAQTVYGGGDLLRRAVGQERIIHQPDVQAAMTAPDTQTGRGAKLLTDAVQYAIPATRATRMMRGAPLVQRALVDAGTAATVAGVHTAGDGDAMLMAGAGGAVLPFAGAAARTVGRTAQRAAAGAREGGTGGFVAGMVRDVAPGEPRTLLVQALKPRATKVGFEGSLDRALPDLKAVEATLGRPIASVDDLAAATRTAKKAVYGEIAALNRAATGVAVDGTPIADSITRSIPRTLRLENPTAAEGIEQVAGAYRRSFGLDEMEQLLKEANADLDALYNKFPGAQRKALTADPEWARLDAKAKAMRSAIDAALEQATQGGGAAASAARRRYGALIDIEDAADRRALVAKRQQPLSLSEQIAEVNGAADRAAGLYRMVRGGFSGSIPDVIGGGADIVRGQVRRETAKFIKDQQTTDALIRRAFAGYRPRSASGTPAPAPPRR